MRLVVVAGVLAMLPGTAGFVVSGFSSGANVAINTMMVGPLLACGRETSLYLQPIRDANNVTSDTSLSPWLSIAADSTGDARFNQSAI